MRLPLGSWSCPHAVRFAASLLLLTAIAPQGRAVEGTPSERRSAVELTDAVGRGPVGPWTSVKLADYTEQAILGAEPTGGPAARAELGRAAAVDGEVLVVGAPNQSVAGAGSGAAFVYRRQSTGWVREATIVPSDGAASNRFGAAVAVQGDVAVVGAPRRSAGGLSAAGAAYVFSRSGSTWRQVAALTPTVPEADAEYGSAVAVDGTLVVVCAPRASVGEARFAGLCEVYDLASGTPDLVQTLAALVPQASASFGWALQTLDDALVVGAPFENDGEAADAGAVHVFDRVAAGYAAPVRLALSVPEPHAGFGAALSHDGELLVVGAPSAQAGGVAAGVAHVLRRSGQSWVEEARLESSAARHDDGVGSSVAVTGDLVALGAPGSDRAAQDGGAVVLFRRDGSTWSEAEQLTLTDAADFDWLGTAVAATASELLVGSPNHDQESVKGGTVVVYDHSGSAAFEVARLVGSGTTFGFALGRSLAVDGDRLAVGAPNEEVDGVPTAGAIHVFTFDGETWVHTARLVAPAPAAGDQLGSSVGLSGSTLVAGAWQRNTTAEGTGAAFVFTLSGDTWSHSQTLVPSGGRANDYFGVSLALDSGTLVVGSAGGSRGYVYAQTGSTWTESARLDPYPRPVDDFFTAPVAVDGDTLVLGGPHDPSGPSASIYTRQGSGWTLQQRLMSPFGQENPSYGTSVALRGDTLAVGAPYSQPADVPGPGAACVYRRAGAAWSLETTLSLSQPEPEVDSFGAALAVGPDTIAAGAPTASDRDGEVVVFTRSASGWEPSQTVQPSNPPTGANFGATVSLDERRLAVGAPYAPGIDGAAAGGALFVFAAGAPPVADFSWLPERPTAGEQVQLFDDSTGGPTSWQWSFGDGATSSDRNPAHAFARPGTYAVGLTAANAGGSSTVTRQVEVDATDPHAAFAWSPGNPIAGQEVRFVDTTTGGPLSWLWDFGDGAGSSSPDPRHTYASTGDYTVTLTVSNERGAHSASRVIGVGRTDPFPTLASLPAVARVRGTGAFFTSRVDLFNASVAPLRVDLLYTPRLDLGGPTWLTTLDVPARTLYEVEDPLGSWYGFEDGVAAVGSLQLAAGGGSPEALLAQSVVVARNADGTEYGQGFPAWRPDQALTPAADAYLSSAVDASRTRVNVGLMALEDGTAVTLTPVDPVGVELAPGRAYALDAGVSAQLNDLDQAFSLGGASNYLVRVRVTDGRALAYASILDGTASVPGTSDPMTVRPATEGSSRVTLLELGPIQGFDEFSGSASISNLSPTATTVTADFYVRGTPGVAASTTVNLGAGDTAGYSDLVGDLFELSGVGTVVLSSDSGAELMATGREFAIFRDGTGQVTGTAGQLIPGMADTELLEPGVTYHLIGLRQLETSQGLERSHIAVFNPGSETVTLAVRVVDGETGTDEGSTTITVRAGELVQVNNLISAVNPGQDGGVKRLEVATDRPVFVKAFRVNRFGDPVTLDALKP